MLDSAHPCLPLLEPPCPSYPYSAHTNLSSAMGKSRSATILLAYLLWSSRQPPSTSSNTADMVSLPPTPFTVESALMLLRRGRPIAEPNEGFMDQLYLYVDMGCPTTQSELEGHKLYRRWMNKRNVAESLRINQAPDMGDILFEDENPPKPGIEAERETNQTSSASDPPTDSLSNLSVTTNQAPVAPGISAPTGTEPASTHPNANSIAPSKSEPTQDLLLKCRKCRHLLARSNFILPHTALHSDPSTHQDPSTSPDHTEPSTSTTTQLSPKCAHIFLHPLSWMRPALSPGTLEGRLTCPNPKCGANIGKFAWQGLRCSCGGWVTPGFGVARGKVDEVWVGAGGGSGVGAKGGPGPSPGSGGLGAAAGGGALRLPPGMKRDGKI